MNKMHRANRTYWDNLSSEWKAGRDEDGLWKLIRANPELAFEGEALEMIKEFVGGLNGKRVCVIGSGDNYAAFALAGLGATVTSTDISEPQLDVARQRARELGLDIRFVRCDAVDLASASVGEFDLVCSTNGFFVWIADLDALFASVSRVLKPGGYYIFYDIHPFLRPWKDQVAIEMERTYFETGPFQSGAAGDPSYTFHWTISDIINSLGKNGLSVRRMAESAAKDSRFWEGSSYLPGNDW